MEHSWEGARGSWALGVLEGKSDEESVSVMERGRLSGLANRFPSRKVVLEM